MTPSLVPVAALVATLVVGAATAFAADPAPATDKERIDYLMRQSQRQSEEIAQLKTEVARPKSRQEAFAQCMQAAGTAPSAMAAESIGEHCDKLLKQ